MQSLPRDNVRAHEIFNLTDRVAVITGGAGLLGEQHAIAISNLGGTPVLLDLNADLLQAKVEALRNTFGVPALGLAVDITDRQAISRSLDAVLARFGRVDILINNAANNPKVEDRGEVNFSRFENFPLSTWEGDLAVGLTG